MNTVQVHDKKFKISLPSEKIQNAITDMAKKINSDLKDEEVIFIGILNGSFMFAADLLKQITLDCHITFLKLASYQGMSSSGKVKRLIGINEDIENKTVVILEDIIDTGITMESILRQLRGYQPKNIKMATLLFKPDAFLKDFEIDYIGLSISNEFIVGYGLDYNGYGRNLQDIYTVINEES